eukprot:12891386-Prorocentrum_lima.AAC.1
MCLPDTYVGGPSMSDVSLREVLEDEWFDSGDAVSSSPWRDVGGEPLPSRGDVAVQGVSIQPAARVGVEFQADR